MRELSKNVAFSLPFLSIAVAENVSEVKVYSPSTCIKGQKSTLSSSSLSSASQRLN